MGNKDSYTPEEAARYAHQYHLLMDIGMVVRKSLEINRDLKIPGIIIFRMINETVNEFERNVPREFREQEPIRTDVRDLTALIPEFVECEESFR